MKHIFFLLILFSSVLCFGQFTDNFSDGDFTANPEWIGDTDNFIVNTSKELQLNAEAAAGSSYLSTASKAIENASWEFLVKMSFNPSGSNYCDVYLVSNSSNINTATNGYFVKLGNSDDEVSLYRKDISGDVKIIDGKNKRLDMDLVNVRVKVTRDELGNWTLMSDTLGGTNYYAEGVVFDDTYKQSTCFGVKCTYTQTRSKQFFFDDFVVTGDAYVDNEPPQVLSVSPISLNEINVVFSEPTDLTTSLDLNNYFLSPDLGNPISAVENTAIANSITISFSSEFTESSYVLTIENVKDVSGNIMEKQDFDLVFPSEYDIVINEIRAKVDAALTSLPEAKYIELYNRTNSNINLGSWSISHSTTIRKIPDCVIPAKSYIVLCNTTAVDLFSEIGINNVVGVSGFPSLNTGSGILTLRDSEDKVIHTVSYSDTWYKDNLKKERGYALEMIDTDNPCEGYANWVASSDRRGGTPGVENSVKAVNPDISAPYPYAAEIIKPDTVVVYFNENLKAAYANNPNNFKIEGFGNPLWVKAKEPDFSTITMQFSSAFEQGEIYYLEILDNIIDCSGNTVPVNTNIKIAIPDSVSANDIVINEILFNPFTGAKRFVEVYNKSEKVLDLKLLWLANRDGFGDLDNSVQISTISRLLFPGDYCAITTDTEDLKNNYQILFPNNLFQTKSLPSISSDGGTIVLIDSYLNIIDEVKYDKSQHYKLLASQKGVSLERINFARPSSDLSNWHSASQAAGFATPGYKNSQYASEIITESTITLTPKAFSPDNDGFEDRLTISYKLDEPGYTATMSIYNSGGFLITDIVNNEMLGMEGNFFWDGFDNANNRCPMGVYILYVELFNLSGKKVIEKHAVVLSK